MVHVKDDPIVMPERYGLPTYRELVRAGAKSTWFSYFESVKGGDAGDARYFGHWIWIRLLNDEASRVQDRERIARSKEEDATFGFVPSDEGGGSVVAEDEKGRYESVFEWLNAQVKGH